MGRSTLVRHRRGAGHLQQATRYLFHLGVRVDHQNPVKLGKKLLLKVLIRVFSLVLLGELLADAAPVHCYWAALNPVQAMGQPAIYVPSASAEPESALSARLSSGTGLSIRIL